MRRIIKENGLSIPEDTWFLPAKHNTPPARISAIIQKHAIFQQLLHNQWLNLVAHDPHTFEFHRYNPDATWEVIG